MNNEGWEKEEWSFRTLTIIQIFWDPRKSIHQLIYCITLKCYMVKVRKARPILYMCKHRKESRSSWDLLGMSAL